MVSNNMRIDLHTHSAFSDGTDTPTELIDAAVAVNLHVVALTDHDTTRGWEEAGARAAQVGVEFVPGVEVSAHYAGHSVHVLGWWPEENNPDMQTMFAATRGARLRRAQHIVELLQQRFPISWPQVVAAADGAETIGRPHIADALVNLGIVGDRSQAFAEILAGNPEFYVPHYAPRLLPVVETLRRAGAVVALAHPLAQNRGEVLAPEVYGKLAQTGLHAVEVDHRDHTLAERATLRQIVARHGLLTTGASDYHGSGKPNALGENTTDYLTYQRLKALRP